ncbi:unnamed protein product [Protopolystoma xenopodis]|uniref:Uncharacterized protein n=1 Tax=Protopolystoma xenopodis TaxID=117903 RepID=A0A448WXR5_9PLAT|nr:unnamed protein product [Protopolystoma xenopodis]
MSVENDGGVTKRPGMGMGISAGRGSGEVEMRRGMREEDKQAQVRSRYCENGFISSPQSPNHKPLTFNRQIFRLTRQAQLLALYLTH